MRFTRKIPGIRLPIPGRKDEAAPTLEFLSPGWSIALVYIFLLAVLGIWFFCTMQFGGFMSSSWLETKVLGLSLYAIATGVNGLTIAYAVATFLNRYRKGRASNGKKVAGFLFLLGVLGCAQVFLNGWKNLAIWDRENTVAELEEQTAAVEEFRTKLADLGEHPWGGEYVSHESGAEIRMLLAPDQSAYLVFRFSGYSEKGPLHERARFDAVPSTVAIEEGQLIVPRPFARREEPRYHVVEWGERRYLVSPEALDQFLVRENEPASKAGVYHRLGDESRPLEGRPTVLRELR
jgi:hypothetical protein